mmetsp:Transcript_3726/g.8881  ORF Transcript_3726/g.8881 Transcript_3726/m.8881 type:complete len:311 (+) Transcript_3726:189-1121(+)
MSQASSRGEHGGEGHGGSTTCKRCRVRICYSRQLDAAVDGTDGAASETPQCSRKLLYVVFWLAKVFVAILLPFGWIALENGLYDALDTLLQRKASPWSSWWHSLWGPGQGFVDATAEWALARWIESGWSWWLSAAVYATGNGMIPSSRLFDAERKPLVNHALSGVHLLWIVRLLWLWLTKKMAESLGSFCCCNCTWGQRNFLLGVPLKCPQCMDRANQALSAAFEDGLDPPEPLQEIICVVCLYNHATRVIIPCGHQCLCRTCADQVRDSTGKCPLCRVRATHFTRVFRVGGSHSDTESSSETVKRRQPQ